MYGNIILYNLLAIVLDAILTSTLIREIGLQFLRNLLSLSFYFRSKLSKPVSEKWRAPHEQVRSLNNQLNIFQREAKMQGKTQPWARRIPFAYS